MRRVELAVVGGGPAGLAIGIRAARRGLEVLVLERQASAPDKACGEGLMPDGVVELERLGAMAHLDRSQTAPFSGIRYAQEDGTRAQGEFRGGPGLGIRRTALTRALERAALDAGVEIVRAQARNLVVDAHHLELEAGERIQARLLVAADGLHSPIRRQLGLTRASAGAKRLGLRRHVECEVPSHVEVHWAEGVECYLTPVGPRRLGVAFLVDPVHHPAPTFEGLLARFPALHDRLGSAPTASELRGAGPLFQRVAAVVQGRVALLGDAAGYVDAITGQGLSLAFQSARHLAELLPAALERPERLGAYAAAHARLFASHARSAGLLVWLSRRPWLRRRVIRGLARVPGAFDLALATLGRG